MNDMEARNFGAESENVNCKGHFNIQYNYWDKK